MIRRIFADWPWKLLSLCAAVAIWVAVASEPEMATVLRVPVQYKNDPVNLEISSDIASNVRLELIGASGRLKEFSAVPTPVVLDFSSVRGPGERTFSIDASTVKLPRGVHLVRAVPAQMRFVFERQERRAVPVEVQWSGTLRRGEQIGSVRAKPATLEIVGPESKVNLVQSVSTDPVDLGTLRSGEPVTTSPFISEAQVRFVNFQPVRVTAILKD